MAPPFGPPSIAAVSSGHLPRRLWTRPRIRPSAAISAPSPSPTSFTPKPIATASLLPRARACSRPCPGSGSRKESPSQRPRPPGARGLLCFPSPDKPHRCSPPWPTLQQAPPPRHLQALGHELARAQSSSSSRGSRRLDAAAPLHRPVAAPAPPEAVALLLPLLRRRATRSR